MAGLDGLGLEDYNAHSRWRYEIEPFIEAFAQFESFRDKECLELGVGLGADHQRFAEAGAVLWGMDLTQRSIEHTSRRFVLAGLKSLLIMGDAENLPYGNDSFDLVYSWGVLHHSPDTEKAVKEAYRVLKPGGEARVMVYHKYCMVGFMLWLRFALFRFRPFTSLDTIYSNHLESPGTKAYSIRQAKHMFSNFEELEIKIQLSSGDLLDEHVGQRHQGSALEFAKKIWPRRFILKFLDGFGLFMLISGRKPRQ